MSVTIFFRIISVVLIVIFFVVVVWQETEFRQKFKNSEFLPKLGLLHMFTGGYRI